MSINVFFLDYLLYQFGLRKRTQIVSSYFLLSFFHV
jgi:hypothetical protein